MSDPAHMPLGEMLERVQCQWCQGMNSKTALACQACGAPLDIRNFISESGWRDASGELVVLPLHPGMEPDAREHAFLLSSHQIDYSFVRVKSLTNIFFRRPGPGRVGIQSMYVHHKTE